MSSTDRWSAADNEVGLYGQHCGGSWTVIYLNKGDHLVILKPHSQAYYHLDHSEHGTVYVARISYS